MTHRAGERGRCVALRVAAVSAVLAFASGCFDLGRPPSTTDAADTAAPPPPDAAPDAAPKDSGGTDSGEDLCSCDAVCPVDETIAGPVTLADVQAILSARCSDGSCHVGGALGEGETLTAGQTCANTVDVPAVQTAGTTGLDRIEPFDPEASYLFHKVRGTHVAAGGEFCRMPRDRCCLSAIELGTIRRWILDGAICL